MRVAVAQAQALLLDRDPTLKCMAKKYALATEELNYYWKND